METCSFSSRNELPAEAGVDVRHLEACGTQAALYVPYAQDGVVRYLPAVVTNRDARDWPSAFVDRL